MKKCFYITTPIYYPNNNLHLGHAYTTTIADIFARYKKAIGYDVFFLTGSDEHGQKIAKTAKENNLSPKLFVDQVVANFKDLWEKLAINYSRFIRTTDQQHEQIVQEIFSILIKKGDIYLGNYQGWYCISCEEFVTDSQINSNDNTCLICGHNLTLLSEPSYFFKISKYQEQLIDYYHKNPDFLWPETRKSEMINSFIKNGLVDLSISRTTFDWGVIVRENKDHVVYVWIDALSNYLSALGYLQTNDKNFQKFWNNEECEIVQLVGKEITRFHAIYWPILLMSLNLRQPNHILSHGWIVNEQGKMSKSKGNVVDPRVLIEHFGADAVRCYLSKEIIFGQDGKYSHELFCQFFNSYLVNDLGNLLSRVITMIDKFNNSKIPALFFDQLDYEEKNICDLILQTIEDYNKEMKNYQISNAMNKVWILINSLNKFIEISQPWTLNNIADNKKLNNVLNLLANGLYVIANLLLPVLINKSEEIFIQLGVKNSFQFLKKFDFLAIANNKVKKGKPLFARINIYKEVDYLINLSKVSQQ